NRITAGSVTGTQIPVGNFVPQVTVAPCPAQLLVFAIDSAFALIPNVAWTAMPGDVVMKPPLKVPINLWVLQAPPPPEDPSVPANPDVRSQANGDAGQASLLYNTQTAGIVFLPNAKDMTASATPALLN